LASTRDAQFERKLNVQGRPSIEISVRSGCVQIRRGEEGSITIRGALRVRQSIFDWNDPAALAGELASSPPVVQEGNTILIGAAADRSLFRRVKFLLEIEAPPDACVRAVGDSAGLFIEGIHGPVDCQTDSGEIELQDVQSQVSVSSDSGSISIRQVAGPVEARSDSGEILALEIGGGIDARTDSGGIDVSQTLAAPVYARSDSGRITVKLAEAGGYNVRVCTDNGLLDLPEMRQVSASRRELEGWIRGGGSMVDIATDSGDIRVL